MAHRIVLGVVLIATMGMGVGCSTSPHESAAFNDKFFATFYSLAVIKALDAGNTERAYHHSLINLKESLIGTEALWNASDVSEDQRRMARSQAMVVLNHLEKHRERAALNPQTTHLALQITETLSKILTGRDVSQRLDGLRSYFGGKFVEERKALKKALEE